MYGLLRAPMPGSDGLEPDYWAWRGDCRCIYIHTQAGAWSKGILWAFLSDLFYEIWERMAKFMGD